MAKAWVEISNEVLELLNWDPYCHQVRIERATPFDHHSVIALVHSRLIRENVSQIQDLIITKNGLRFKTWLDV